MAAGSPPRLFGPTTGSTGEGFARGRSIALLWGHGKTRFTTHSALLITWLLNLYTFWRFELSKMSAFSVLCLNSSNILPNCTIYKIMWKFREGSGEKKIRIKTKAPNFCLWTITYVIYWAVYPLIIHHSRILCTSRTFHCLLQGESLLKKSIVLATLILFSSHGNTRMPVSLRQVDIEYSCNFLESLLSLKVWPRES